MTITLNGTTGITTPDVTSSGSLNIDASAPDNSLVVNASGNLGLGVTPSAWSVFKAMQLGSTMALGGVNGTSSNVFANTYYDGAYKYIGTGSAYRYEQNIATGYHAWHTAPSGTAGAAISFTQAMTLDASGNLLVGTTSLGGKGFSLTIGNDPTIILNGLDGSNTVVSFRYNSTQVGSITRSTTATSYNTSSDYRLKEDWQPMAGASERVKALKPVNFAWKADGSRVDGFLAHEAQAVVPEAVTGAKDAVQLVDIKDEEGNVTGQEERPVYQGIDQSKLVPLLTAALQEALAEIETLKARVSALEAA